MEGKLGAGDAVPRVDFVQLPSTDIDAVSENSVIVAIEENVAADVLDAVAVTIAGTVARDDDDAVFVRALVGVLDTEFDADGEDDADRNETVGAALGVAVSVEKALIDITVDPDDESVFR